MKSKQQKRTEAEQRQVAHDALTTDEKITKALRRRADGAGFCGKELRRLYIAASKEAA